MIRLRPSTDKHAVLCCVCLSPRRLVEEGLLSPQADIQVPEIPMDLATAVKLKKVCVLFHCWLYMAHGGPQCV